VTGASEGIGKSYALGLAQQGFNLVLASRSYRKLDGVRQEINELNPETKVKIVSIDL